MPEADITAIVPVWDRYSAFLPGCVRNLRAQDGVHVELLVIDNASTLALPALDEVRVLRSARRLSIGAARNLAISQARSELLCFADVDDLLLPGTLEFLAARMRARPELVSCGCRLAVWEPDSGKRTALDWPDCHLLAPIGSARAWAWAESVEHRFPMASCSLHRAAAVRDAGGFMDANRSEDWALGASLAWRGPMEFHERLGRLYRDHDGLDRVPASARELRGDYRQLRRWLRADRRVPAWAKLLSPYLAARHWRLAKRYAR